jgi:serine protease inhibitor
MNKETEDYYYWSDNVGAINLRFSGAVGSKMWLILPDEGVSTDEILNSGEIEEFFTPFETMSPLYTHPNSQRIIINISMPKFDTAYSVDLKDGLTKMGITDVFDSETADFSALLGAESADTALSVATHSVRVAVDEKGCTATAFTAMMAAGAARPPEEEIDFVLNRPFIFILQGVSGDPVFAGVINNPTI